MKSQPFRILSVIMMFILLFSQSSQALAVPGNLAGGGGGNLVFLPLILKGSVLPGAFNKATPANGAVSQLTSLTLDWADSSWATSYAYCYDTTDDNACSNWTSTGTTSQASLSGLNKSTTYYWQAKATNIAGDTFANGGATVFWSFTTNNATQAEMVSIPAGNFQMGCDPAHNGGYPCYSEELPLHTVYLDAYCMDKYEVTNALYAECVAAGNCAAPVDSSSHTRASYYGNSAYDSYPVIYVDWYSAANYCTWAGKRLPTEAEWEKAERGGSDTRAFPWGDASPDCTLANYWITSACVGDTSMVGSYPAGASPYGLFDMAGNVWEWVSDWYGATYYGSQSSWANPTGPATGDSKALRGGGWPGSDNYLRVPSRSNISPTIFNGNIGIRCAASPANGATPPGAFDKAAPANGAPSQPTSATLDWGDSSGATSYAYCYDTTNDNACTNWVTAASLTSQAAISGLSASTTYYWQVKATNTAGPTYGNGSPTASWSFTTGSGTVIPGEMVIIPAGNFQMGCDPAYNGGNVCNSDGLPLHTVYLDAYRIDKYEVTNAQYTQCVAAGNCAAPSYSSSYTHASYYGNSTYDSYPVIYTAWQDATNYCTWAGKRLPSEAEWEKAARGTTVQAFPWGDASPICSLANFYNNGYCVGDTSAVGSYPAGASPYGALDMAGNVWEWVNDWYDAAYYGSQSNWTNPNGPANGSLKVLRGGGWYGDDIGLRVAYRLNTAPTLQSYNLGFRCAAAPGP